MLSGVMTGKFQPIAASFHELPRKHLVGTIIGLQLSLLLAALDQTIVSTAMPKIIANLNGFERYAWVTTAYMLASTTAVPIFGKLSDMFGRKWILLASACAFVFTSALCGVAGNIPWLPGDGIDQLIVFRGLQGIAGGTIMAMVFTCIGDIFPPIERGKYQGLFSAVFGLASVVGPALGGWITDSLSWRWVFYVNVPVGALAIAVLWFAFPHIEPSKSKGSIDYAGVATLIGCVVPLLLALTWVVDIGWTAPQIIGLLAFSAVMLLCFIYCEQKAEEPIIPLKLFENQIISLSSISLVMLGMAMFGSIIFIPLFMQSVIGLSASRSGSLLTPMMLMMTAGSVVSGQLSSRTGKYKMIAISGLAIMLFGMILLSRLSVSTTEFEAVRDIIIIGIGNGLMMPIYTLAVQNAAPPKMIGAATSTTQFFRSVGGTLGTAIFGSILMSRYLDHLSKSLPPSLPAADLAALRNPLHTALGPTQLAALSMHGHGPGSAAIVSIVKQGLVSGTDSIFLIGSVLVAVALILNLFLKEVPLRKSHVLEVAPSTQG